MPVDPSPLVFSRAGLREVDRRAGADFGLPVLVLMENAGRALADAVCAYRPARVLIVCGPGNNGGDGLVAARHLHNAGTAVTVALLAPAERYHDAAGAHVHTITQMRLPVLDLAADPARLDSLLDATPRPDVVVDALFGTGLTRPVTGPAAAVIAALNASGLPIVAADLPSGLDCDTGQPLGACIRAAVTVSFCGPKLGFAAPGAAAYTGRIVTGDIGAPRALLAACAH